MRKPRSIVVSIAVCAAACVVLQAALVAVVWSGALAEGTASGAGGTPLGSPLYWAPEQATHASVGAPADVYALGGIAYYGLSRA